MQNTVLLVVDIQNGLVRENPYNRKPFLENVGRLISQCRRKGIEVIYVRHDDGPGSELERGTEGWEICGEVAPLAGEKIFEKQYNSAFLKTGLKEYLDGKNVKTIILVGMQTEYCIDATCKSAFEQGFQVITPEGTNTTFDNEFLSGKKSYEFYMEKIWNGRFARVLPLGELEEEL